MKACHDIEIQLTAYAAGELDAQDAALVAAHLAACSACREEVARETLLRRTMGSLPDQPCPAGVSRELNDLDASRRRPRDHRTARSHWPGGLGLVAAAVLAIVLLPGLLRQPEAEPEVAVPVQRWTNEEIADARKDMLYTLALTAAVLDRTSKSAMADVFGDRIPQAVTGSFKVKSTTRGGNG
jgi:anti-sigma factor RsiW